MEREGFKFSDVDPGTIDIWRSPEYGLEKPIRALSSFMQYPQSVRTFVEYVEFPDESSAIFIRQQHRNNSQVWEEYPEGEICGRFDKDGNPITAAPFERSKELKDRYIELEPINVPQLSAKTGISYDYINEYVSKEILIAAGERDRVAQSFRDNPIKKYEQRFSPEEYVDVVNDRNRPTVLRLDEIAETANTIMTDPNNFTEGYLRKMLNEVHDLIGE